MKINFTFKTFCLIFFSYLLLANINNANAQCSTSIVALRDTIACGDSLLLKQVGVGGTSSDDFSGGTLSGLWQTVTFGWTLNNACSVNPAGGQNLWFGNTSTTPRTATTVPVDASCGGNICFDFRTGIHPGGNICDGPEGPDEGIYVQYKVTGGAWTTIQYMSSAPTNGYSNWGNYCYPIPLLAQTQTTQFRWNQTNTSGNIYDQWGVDNVNIATCTGYSSLWSGGNIPFGYSLDTITVTPYDTTTYSIIYSNWIDDTCTASLFIGVEQPSILSSTIPAFCQGSDTLDAQATIKSQATSQS